MPKIGFLMPTAKNRFQILNLHPKKHALKKNMILKEKIAFFLTKPMGELGVGPASAKKYILDL